VEGHFGVNGLRGIPALAPGRGTLIDHVVLQVLCTNENVLSLFSARESFVFLSRLVVSLPLHGLRLHQLSAVGRKMRSARRQNSNSLVLCIFEVLALSYLWRSDQLLLHSDMFMCLNFDT
jgi:hypothetical protein